MNLLGIYTVGIAPSLCKRLLLASNRKLSIVIALSPRLSNMHPWKLQNSVKKGKIRAISPINVIQGHLFWYQSKAHIRLPISG